MKKLIPLLLAVFVLFSAIIPLSAEAASAHEHSRIEYAHDHDHDDHTCIHDHDHTCTHDHDHEEHNCEHVDYTCSHDHDNEDQIAATCTHSYLYNPYDIQYHENECRKCGITFKEKHLYSIYSSWNSTQHRVLCSRCGQPKFENHTFAVFQHNEIKHKLVCSRCGYTKYEKHTMNGIGRCTQCNYGLIVKETCTNPTSEEKAICNHIYHYVSIGDIKHRMHCEKCLCSATESHDFYPSPYNKRQHKLVCRDCGHTKFASHNFNTNGVCRTCGYTGGPMLNGAPIIPEEQAACTHSFAYSNLGIGKHKKYCTKCSYYTTEGHTRYFEQYNSQDHREYCSKCNYSSVQNHSFAAYQYTQRQHKLVCRDCGYTKFASHSFNTNGVCRTCGYTGGPMLNALPVDSIREYALLPESDSKA